MNQIKIGQFIATLRKEKKLKQKDIAIRLGISEKTVSKWEYGNGLPEVVYMEPLCQILGISVNELLAGKRIPLFDLMESLDESRIELMKQLEFEQLKLRLYKLYGIEIKSMDFFENGASSLTYIVKTNDNRYIVKYLSDNEMNHLDVEVRVCERLLNAQIPVCKFIMNKKQNKISIDESGRRFTLQTYYEGHTYDYYEAPVELQSQSAQLLAKIHQTMKNYEDIPIGIGEAFFKHRKIESVKINSKKWQQKND